MRVLQIDSGREWRGGQNQVRLLCRELAREGVDQVLVTKRGSELARHTMADGGTEVAETSWGWGLDPRAWFRIDRLVARFKPDILHAHDSHALGMAPRGGDARVVATRRVDFHVGRFSGWRRTDRIIAISRAIKEILATDGVPATEITVIPSGIDPDEVRRAAVEPARIRALLRLASTTPLAVNVAALVDHKDQHTLIRAAHSARAARPDLHWAIAGEGKLRGSLTAEIARLGLADRVHLLGYVDRADALIREADVFVMSSKEEGLGSVILNALALGKPVVATAAGGIPEILPAAALVPVGDSAALARKVVAMLKHPSPVPLPPQFTASAMAHSVLAVYHSLL